MSTKEWPLVSRVLAEEGGQTHSGSGGDSASCSQIRMI